MTAKKAARKASTTRTKPTAKSTGMVKVPQPHGGALNAGGTPGNKGGPGRPPDALRELSREEFHEVLMEIRRRREAGVLQAAPLPEVTQLLNTTGKFGLGAKGDITQDELRARMAAMVRFIRSRKTWDSEELLNLGGEIFS